MKPIKEMSFIVHRFMISELGLGGCELIIFAIIYSFCVSSGFFYGTQSYLRGAAGISESSVKRVLTKLYEKGYIEKCVRSGRTGIRVSSFISMPRGAYDEIPGAYCEITDSNPREVGSNSGGAHAQTKLKVDESMHAGVGDKAGDAAHEGYEVIENAHTGTSYESSETERACVSFKSIDEGLPPNDAELLLPPCERVRSEELDVTEWLTKRAPRPKYVFHSFGYEGIVGLTAEQYRRLLRLVDCERLHAYITKLQGLILEKGYRSYNHYKTLKKWILEDTAV